MENESYVATGMSEAAREMRGLPDLDTSLATVVRIARDVLHEVDHVGLTLVRQDGRIVTKAASDDVVVALDQAQYELGSGPCLHAIDVDAVVRVDHARHEQRWPEFIAVAVGLGLRSQLGVPLHVDEHRLGVLNLYSFSSDTISAGTEQLAALFAQHAGVVLGLVRRVDNLNAAVQSRQEIGIALGMVMQRLQVDEDAAFAYLTRLAASSERKLRDVAAAVVEEHQRHVVTPQG